MHPFYEHKHADFSCTLVQNMNFPSHLQNTVELIFVTKGSISVTVQDTTKILPRGNAVLIFPDTLHSYHTTKSSEIFLCIFHTGLSSKHYHTLRNSRPLVPFIPPTDIHPDVVLGVKRMLEFRESAQSLSEAWLYLLLSYLLPKLELESRSSRDKADITYQIIHYLSEHFREPLTLTTLASDLHFNKDYISRVFSKKLNCKFHDYINELRLDYAAHQIKISGKHLTEIWQDAGFESQRTFNRVFREKYSMTPKEYRKANPT